MDIEPSRDRALVMMRLLGGEIEIVIVMKTPVDT